GRSSRASRTTGSPSSTVLDPRRLTSPLSPTQAGNDSPKRSAPASPSAVTIRSSCALGPGRSRESVRISLTRGNPAEVTDHADSQPVARGSRVSSPSQLQSRCERAAGADHLAGVYLRDARWLLR